MDKDSPRRRIKDFLRRIVAVPKKEVEEQMAEHRSLKRRRKGS